MRSIITTSAPPARRRRPSPPPPPAPRPAAEETAAGRRRATAPPTSAGAARLIPPPGGEASSPPMPTDGPPSGPKRGRTVNASGRACVGCSCAPSPALTTPASRWRARKCGTPAEPCRITIRSGDIACRFVAVSRSDSPFSVEVPLPPLKFNESAESHFSAVSNEKRVRVEGSKKRLATIRPRSAGTFLISRWPIDRIDSAVSRMSEISSGSSSPIPRRSFERSAATFGGGGVKASGSPTPGADAGLRARLLQDPDFVGAVGLGEHHLDDLALRGRDALADVVRLDRELPVSPVDQDREADGAGTDRKSTRLNSSHSQISYAVFCLKKKTGGAERSHTAVHLTIPEFDSSSKGQSPPSSTLFPYTTLFRSTSSAPSVSANITLMTSRCAVGTLLPT